MSDKLATRIETLVGMRPSGLAPMGGGCVGDVYRVRFDARDDLVAKVGDAIDLVAKVGDGQSGLALEGEMLRYLADARALPVPEIIHADDTLLLMTYLANDGGLDNSAQTHAADLVAHLHTISTDQGFGFDTDTVIGGLHQPNPRTSLWVDFFRDQRLMYMGRDAERHGRLPTRTLSRLESFCAHLDRWLVEPKSASLIHGDMWGGNVLASNGRISGFIDPAIYYADAEIELAFSTLFNTFGDAFFRRYGEHRAINAGFFEERRDIYNLYPLLVHVRLFGGGYVNSVERTLSRHGF